MRPLAIPSTVPTWTPSAPITSMFWAILSVVIWSLLVVSTIALELHVRRQAEFRELLTHVRREEIPVARAELARRRHLTGGGEDPWQTIHVAHAVRLRATGHRHRGRRQAAFLRGNFQ